MKTRALLVASSGGHWVQLTRLVPAFEGMDVQFVTTAGTGAAPAGDRPVVVVSDASKSHPLNVFPVTLQLTKLILQFRPDIVVTTGAAPGAVALWLAKLLVGAQTVWVDSMANSEKVSLSGRLVAGAADLRLTQWQDLADPAGGIDCFGAVL